MHDESSLRLIPTSEADRTYIARLNFLTDTFGDEHGTLADDFDTESDYYVRDWNPTNGGFIAWRGWVPAGGVWLLWGTDERHGFGYVAEEIPELALAVEGRYTGQGLAPHCWIELLSWRASWAPRRCRCRFTRIMRGRIGFMRFAGLNRLASFVRVTQC